MKKIWTQSLKTQFIQMVKFGLIGILNTAIDSVIYYLFFEKWGIHFVLAKMISFGVAIYHSWFWNSRWTFKSENESEKQKDSTRFAKFVFINLIALGCQIFALFLCEKILGYNGVWANLLVGTPLSFLINFFGNRIFVFKQNK